MRYLLKRSISERSNCADKFWYNSCHEMTNLERHHRKKGQALIHQLHKKILMKMKQRTSEGERNRVYGSAKLASMFLIMSWARDLVWILLRRISCFFSCIVKKWKFQDMHNWKTWKLVPISVKIITNLIKPRYLIYRIQNREKRTKVI